MRVVIPDNQGPIVQAIGKPVGELLGLQLTSPNARGHVWTIANYEHYGRLVLYENCPRSDRFVLTTAELSTAIEDGTLRIVEPFVSHVRIVRRRIAAALARAHSRKAYARES